jgi:hypothetical protein
MTVSPLGGFSKKSQEPPNYKSENRGWGNDEQKSGRKFSTNSSNFLGEDPVGFAVEHETESEEQRIKLVQRNKDIIKRILIKDVEVERDDPDILKTCEV